MIYIEEAGKDVVCIDLKSTIFTFGKVYRIYQFINEKSEYVINDDGKLTSFSFWVKKFQPLGEYRDERINKLINE